MSDPSPSPKVVLVLPAHNEKLYIEHAIQGAQALQSAGAIQEFMVVDDHSTDQTAMRVRRAGAPLLTQCVSSTPGKGEAFLTGALWAKNVGADILVILDSDLAADFDLTPKHIGPMVRALAQAPQTDMVVYPCIERGADPMGNLNGDTVSMDISGQRAIRMSAINYLFCPPTSPGGEFSISESRPALRARTWMHGYGLEIALNALLPHYRYLSAEQFEPMQFARPYRRAGDNAWQDRCIHQTASLLSERRAKLRLALIRRANQSDARASSARPPRPIQRID